MEEPLAPHPGQPVPPDHPAPPTRWQHFLAWRARHAVAESSLFFGCGFVFDVVTLSRIDDIWTMLQLGTYLLMLAGLMFLGELYLELKRAPPRLLARVVPFLQSGIHFFLGSVLSCFTLFYFKSASGVASMAFTLGMFALVLVNEFPAFRHLGPVMRSTVFSFCISSYLAFVFPTLLGRLSWVLFVAALVVSLLLSVGLARLLRRIQPDERRIRRVVLYPAILVNTALLGLYVARAVPPVPLSIYSMGVYHNVTREGGSFRLTSQPKGWKFWHRGDQEFLARPGDRVFVFAQIFAPRHFRDRVNIRWLHAHPKLGWSSSDVIALSVTGGRDEGFRGYAYKGNWRPGDWRVEVETEDGRTIGYITFTVVEDPSTDIREMMEEVR